MAELDQDPEAESRYLIEVEKMLARFAAQYRSPHPLLESLWKAREAIKETGEAYRAYLPPVYVARQENSDG